MRVKTLNSSGTSRGRSPAREGLFRGQGCGQWRSFFDLRYRPCRCPGCSRISPRRCIPRNSMNAPATATMSLRSPAVANYRCRRWWPSCCAGCVKASTLNSMSSSAIFGHLRRQASLTHEVSEQAFARARAKLAHTALPYLNDWLLARA